MRALALSLFVCCLAACSEPGVNLCLDTLSAKCQKLLDCDPAGFQRDFGDQADVAICVSQVEQDVAADQDSTTQTCEEQTIERPEKKTFETCLSLLPDASCDDFLNNRIVECR